MPTFRPEDLYFELKKAHRDIGKLLVVDISPDKGAVLELTYNDLGLFQLVRMVPLNMSISIEMVETDLLPEIEIDFPGLYPYIYLIGDYADDEMVQTVMSKKATHDDAISLGQDRMPRNVPLKDYLDRQDGIMPYDWVLAMLQMPNIDVRTSRIDDVAVIYETVIAKDDKLRNNRVIKTLEFQTALAGQEMNLYFTKGEDGYYEDYGVCYTIIPQKPTFKLTLSFREGKIDYQWTDAIPTGDNPYINVLMPHPDDMCQVEIDFIAPKVLFLVEATLGLKRLVTDIDDVELENVTDFKIVREFIGNVSTTLKSILGSDAQYNVWYYHDYHPNLITPYEFHRAGVARPKQVIEKLSDDFIQQDHLVNLLKDEDDGIRKPSLAIDWQKPLEVVAHELNQENWGNAGVLLIWIGQSSPHHYHDKNNPNLYEGGIWSMYDFNAEIAQLHQKEITQLALFVNNDLPEPSGIRRGARRTWQQIASKPTEKYFHEIRLVKPDDATLNTSERTSLYNVLEDLFLQRITVLTFIGSRGKSDLWRLPIRDFAPYTQVYHKD